MLMYLIIYRRTEPPDVTGSSLTLAAAGSRRTVYVVDENSIPDTTTQTDPELIPSHTANTRNTSISNNNSNTNSNSNNNNTHDQTPSTFLMYNRISNVIGDPKMVGSSNNQHSPNNSVLNDSNTSNGNNGKDKKKNDDHVWYEYGCV